MTHHRYKFKVYDAILLFKSFLSRREAYMLTGIYQNIILGLHYQIDYMRSILKKICSFGILLLICLFAIYPTLSAIELDQHGLIFGGNFSSLTTDQFHVDKRGRYYGYSFGVYASKFINDSVAVQIELTLDRIGTNLTHHEYYFSGLVDIKEKIGVTYLNLPVLIKLPYYKRSQSNFDISFGPLMSFTLASIRKGHYTSVNAPFLGTGSYTGNIPNTRRMNFGAVIGFDYQFFRNNRFFQFTLRYTRFFTNPFKAWKFGDNIKEDDIPMISYETGSYIRMDNEYVTLSIRMSM